MANTPEQDQWLKDTQRWSKHLGTMPQWLAGADEATQTKFRDLYNADDPNAAGNFLSQQEQAFTAANTAAGRKTNATSADVFASREFQDFLNTGQVAPGQPQAAGSTAQQAQGAQGIVDAWKKDVSVGAPVGAPYAPGTPSNSERNTSLWSSLRDRANQGLNVQNDPVVKAQIDAFRAEQEIAEREYLADLAESESVSGGPINLRGEQRMASERRGRNVGGFAAEIMAREVGFRREEIAQALAQQGEMLSEDQRVELQRQLAELDARLREFGFEADNNFRNAQLAEQRRQFDDRFGLEEWEALNLDDLIRRGLR